MTALRNSIPRASPLTRSPVQKDFSRSRFSSKIRRRRLNGTPQATNSSISGTLGAGVKFSIATPNFTCVSGPAFARLGHGDAQGLLEHRATVLQMRAHPLLGQRSVAALERLEDRDVLVEEAPRH